MTSKFLPPVQGRWLTIQRWWFPLPFANSTVAEYENYHPMRCFSVDLKGLYRPLVMLSTVSFSVWRLQCWSAISSTLMLTSCSLSGLGRLRGRCFYCLHDLTVKWLLSRRFFWYRSGHGTLKRRVKEVLTLRERGSTYKRLGFWLFSGWNETMKQTKLITRQRKMIGSSCFRRAHFRAKETSVRLPNEPQTLRQMFSLILREIQRSRANSWKQEILLPLGPRPSPRFPRRRRGPCSGTSDILCRWLA